jgi:16S rRNA (guanine527-N7)-methyltransferase
VRLSFAAAYKEYGLSDELISSLAQLGDLILEAGLNITALTEPEEIERQHFLDSLSLLTIPSVTHARQIVDIGSGGGLPALLLALALPASRVTALESLQKKCIYIESTARELGLTNVQVVCARAEDYGRDSDSGRAAHDVAVSRALAALPVVAEYSLPLLALNGTMVAMKGQISDQERIQASKALGILGADTLEAERLEPFEGAVNRWVYMARKVRPTPEDYPRRAGTPAKRPLGEASIRKDARQHIDRKGMH